MTIQLSYIDFSPGKLVYMDFNIKDDLPLNKQIDMLKEDLLQVEFPSNLILDVGWFPSFNKEGQFQIRVVHDYDWQQPIFYGETNDLQKFYNLLTEAINLCKAFSSNI